MIEIGVKRGILPRVTGRLSRRDSVVVTLTDEDALQHDADVRDLFGWKKDDKARIPLEDTVSPGYCGYPDISIGTNVAYQDLARPAVIQTASRLSSDSSLRFPQAGKMHKNGVEVIIPVLRRHWKNRHPGTEFSESVIEGLPRAREVFDRDSRVRQRRASTRQQLSRLKRSTRT